MRAGIGFDSHRLAAGRRLVIGGVEIPSERGLEGHSDADVLAHALTDALLGAAGLGDIGEHFPDTDERCAAPTRSRCSSRRSRWSRARAFAIVNVDCTVLMEAPKLAPHRDAIRERLAAALGVELQRVSVKATSGERMGFVGRGEGVARAGRGEPRRAECGARSACTTRAAASSSPLSPRDPGRVGIYACGPTVYSRIHIGNARPFVVFSLLKRFLEHEGYAVELVVNVTDVNDKIYDAARAARPAERASSRRR